MKLIHITRAGSPMIRLYSILIAAVPLMALLPSVPAEAHVVDWPCSHSIETEPHVDISPCALVLISTWQECGRVEETSSEETHKSRRIFLHLQRGIALIAFVVCATTEFTFDLLENTLGNSQMSRKDH